jgi:phage shock protein PspC (stress-responsive transcriptional regulator)
MENQKKLYRSRSKRVIAGVAGGLGEYFNIDPILVRVIFVCAALINGIGILLYLILMIVIPKEPVEKKIEVKEGARGQGLAQELKEGVESVAKELKEEFGGNKNWWSETRNIVGLAIVIVGFIVLLNQIFPLHIMRWELLWPSIIILIGLYIFLKKER